jgi:hypothetical protein
MAAIVLRRAGPGAAGRLAACALVLGALAGFTPGPENPILFPARTVVPRPVQDFAWRVIETRCNYQSHERQQRSFWAYGARTRDVEGGTAYSIEILSSLSWRKTEPPAVIAMTVVDDGTLHLAALTSSFVTCAS